MRYALSILLLFAQVAGAANEFAAIVPAGSTGVYGVIVNNANQAQGYDITTDDGSTYLTFDRTDSDQQISFGSAIAVGGSDERQVASLPSGLSTSTEYTMLVFDSSDELLGSIRYVPQYSTQSVVDANMVQASGSATAADNLEANYTGTIVGFDGLDAAQDIQHSNTQSLHGTYDSGNAAEDLESIAATITSAQAGITATNNRLGAWSGSGRNTILGALQALMRSDADATVPSDINADLGSGAGSADNTTDSTQAVAASTPAIADAVLDEALSGHATSGTLGERLAAIFAKLPAGGRNMAGAGDTATDLDDIEGGGGGATTPVLNRKPTQVIRVSSKADGYLTTNRVKIYSAPSGTPSKGVIALEYPNPHDWLFGMTLPVSPDTNQLTVNADAYGPNRNWALVEVTIANGLAAGTEITLPVLVHPEEGVNDWRKIVFEVIDPPQ